MRRLPIPITWCLFNALGLAASLPVARPEQSGMSPERLKRLSAAMRGYIDRQEVAGTVTLIARHGRIVHFEAQGVMDAGSKTPMKTEAIFRLASMTKPITSVAVMMLLEEGRFALSDPVSKFIPEFKDAKVMVANPPGTSRAGRKLVPADREITIEHLLTHTAGLITNTSSTLHDAAPAARPPEHPGADAGARHASDHGLATAPSRSWDDFDLVGLPEGWYDEAEKPCLSPRWSDTSPEAMKVFVELHRQMSPAQKAARVMELSRTVLALAETGVRRRHPQAGEREVFLRTAALHLPRDLMIRAYGWHPDWGPLPTP